MLLFLFFVTLSLDVLVFLQNYSLEKGFRKILVPLLRVIFLFPLVLSL